MEVVQESETYIPSVIDLFPMFNDLKKFIIDIGAVRSDQEILGDMLSSILDHIAEFIKGDEALLTQSILKFQVQFSLECIYKTLGSKYKNFPKNIYNNVVGDNEIYSS